MAFWRDLSIIWLSLFCFVGLVIPIVVLYFITRGLNTVQTKTVALLHTAQGLSRTLRMRTEGVSEQVGEPIIRINSRYAKLQTRLYSLWNVGRFSSK